MSEETEHCTCMQHDRYTGIQLKKKVNRPTENTKLLLNFLPCRQMLMQKII